MEIGKDGSDSFMRPITEARRLQRRKGSRLWRWILIGSSGREIERDVDKYAIMRRLKIDARDFRILDPLLSYPSTILARDKAILLNFEHIKAIITAKQVLLCDPSNDNVIPVVEELRRRLCQVNTDAETGEEDDLPFEFQALEVAMEAICSYLDARRIELESAIYLALDLLTSKISSRNLDRIRNLKSQLTKLTTRVQKVRDKLEQLLDDHDGMANLYLSRKLVSSSPVISGSAAANQHPASPSSSSTKISQASNLSMAAAPGEENDVAVLEMLVEAYYMQIDGTLNKLTALRQYIDNADGYINMQLDKFRNKLIKLDLFLNSGNFSLTIHSLVCAIFGMSIPYGWNEGHGYLFKWVVILTSALGALIFAIIISYARHKGLIISGF